MGLFKALTKKYFNFYNKITYLHASSNDNGEQSTDGSENNDSQQNTQNVNDNEQQSGQTINDIKSQNTMPDLSRFLNKNIMYETSYIRILTLEELMSSNGIILQKYLTEIMPQFRDMYKKVSNGFIYLFLQEKDDLIKQYISFNKNDCSQAHSGSIKVIEDIIAKYKLKNQYKLHTTLDSTSIAQFTVQCKNKKIKLPVMYEAFGTDGKDNKQKKDQEKYTVHRINLMKNTDSLLMNLSNKIFNFNLSNLDLRTYSKLLIENIMSQSSKTSDNKFDAVPTNVYKISIDDLKNICASNKNDNTGNNLEITEEIFQSLAVKEHILSFHLPIMTKDEHKEQYIFYSVIQKLLTMFMKRNFIGDKNTFDVNLQLPKCLGELNKDGKTYQVVQITQINGNQFEPSYYLFEMDGKNLETNKESPVVQYTSYVNKKFNTYSEPKITYDKKFSLKYKKDISKLSEKEQGKLQDKHKDKLLQLFVDLHNIKVDKATVKSWNKLKVEKILKIFFNVKINKFNNELLFNHASADFNTQYIQNKIKVTLFKYLEDVCFDMLVNNNQIEHIITEVLNVKSPKQSGNQQENQQS